MRPHDMTIMRTTHSFCDALFGFSQKYYYLVGFIIVSTVLLSAIIVLNFLS